MKRHVNWDVRQGGDGNLHVTRTEVTRSTSQDGTKNTRIETEHTKTGVTRR